MANEIELRLAKDEAIVLFELLSRFSDTDNLSADDPAEKRVLLDLCCALEKKLPEPLLENYKKLIGRAKKHVLEGCSEPKPEVKNKDKEACQSLVGMRLYQVSFVTDYLQIYFDASTNRDNIILNAYELPVLKNRNQIIKHTDPQYKDVLCGLIEKKVSQVKFDKDKGFSFTLENEATLEILFEAKMKYGEWMAYIDQENHLNDIYW